MKGGDNTKNVDELHVPEGLDSIIVGQRLETLDHLNDTMMERILTLAKNCNDNIITAFKNAALAHKYKNQLDTFLERTECKVGTKYKVNCNYIDFGKGQIHMGNGNTLSLFADYLGKWIGPDKYIYEGKYRNLEEVSKLANTDSQKDTGVESLGLEQHFYGKFTDKGARESGAYTWNNGDYKYLGQFDNNYIKGFGCWQVIPETNADANADTKADGTKADGTKADGTKADANANADGTKADGNNIESKGGDGDAVQKKKYIYIVGKFENNSDKINMPDEYLRFDDDGVICWCYKYNNKPKMDQLTKTNKAQLSKKFDLNVMKKKFNELSTYESVMNNLENFFGVGRTGLYATAALGVAGLGYYAYKKLLKKQKKDSSSSSHKNPADASSDSSSSVADASSDSASSVVDGSSDSASSVVDGSSDSSSSSSDSSSSSSSDLSKVSKVQGVGRGRGRGRGRGKSSVVVKGVRQSARLKAASGKKGRVTVRAKSSGEVKGVRQSARLKAAADLKGASKSARLKSKRV